MSKIQIKGVRAGATMPNVEVQTEGGIARNVIIDGKELRGVTSLNIRYGICVHPLVTVAFIAQDVTIEEKKGGTE